MHWLVQFVFRLFDFKVEPFFVWPLSARSNIIELEGASGPFAALAAGTQKNRAETQKNKDQSLQHGGPLGNHSASLVCVIAPFWQQFVSLELSTNQKQGK